MVNKIAHFKSKLATVTALALLLGSCATPVQQQGAHPTQSLLSPDRKVAALLEEASTALPPESARLSLRAAQILMANEANEEARAILYRINPAQLEDQKDKTRLVYSLAQLALKDNDPEEAWAILNSSRYRLAELSGSQQVAFELLKAELDAAQQNHLSAIKRRVSIYDELRGRDKEENLELIWSHCLALDNQALNKAIASSTGATRAWLELAAIYRYHQQDLEDQIQQLENWLQLNREHAAARNLPRSLEALRIAAENIPHKVAILLPEGSQYKAYSMAIKDGLLAKYYLALEKGLETPVINFYDSTAVESFLPLYRRAVSEGAELVIGPLQKENVEQLQQLERLPVATLALNTTDAIGSPENLYYFSLAAEDEVDNVAARASADGHDKAAIIYPDSEWGTRVMSHFTQTWYDTGGEIIISQPYDRSQPVGKYVSSMLNIDQSEQRANRIRWMLNEKLEFEPRRREDIDFILLLATPRQARQIKPALNFHFARDLPVYATSHVYDGHVQPDKDRDLNGIFFIDMPWMLTSDYPLKNILYREGTSMPAQILRLTALGIDSYSLIARLNALEAAPESRVYGATGTLRLTEENAIGRQLNWAYFSSGQARLLPRVELH